MKTILTFVIDLVGRGVRGKYQICNSPFFLFKLRETKRLENIDNRKFDTSTNDKMKQGTARNLVFAMCGQ